MIYWARQGALAAGWLVAIAGIAAFDWRLAAIVGGAMLAGGAFLGIVFERKPTEGEQDAN